MRQLSDTQAGADAVAEKDAVFTILQHADAHRGPRLGRLALHGRRPIDTPNYLAIASRGVVPHLSQDNFTSNTNINGIYVALEDCKSYP